MVSFLDQKSENNQHWDDYWQNAGRDDQALGGKRQQEVLKSHWTHFFEGVPDNVKILDIACGSGAIFDHASRLKGLPPSQVLIATDQSPSAVMRAEESHSAFGVATDASKMPFVSQSMDFIVSQFGIEYAGEAAFRDAARLLKPQGVLHFVCHCHGGAIYEECDTQLEILSAVVECELFEAAANAILPSINQRKDLSAPFADKKAEERLGIAARKVRDVIVNAPETTARALVGRYFNELLRLSERRLAFAASDAEAWLDAALASIMAYRDRMKSMTQAALTSEDISNLAQSYSELGIMLGKPELMFFSDKGKAGAWVLVGELPAS